MDTFESVSIDFQGRGIDNFEARVQRAADLGASHVLITRDLPLATWQDDSPRKPPEAPFEAETPTQAGPDAEAEQRKNAEEPIGTAGWPEETTGVPERFAYDPYPSWFVHRPGLLKVAPPAAIQPHVSTEWAEDVLDILERRCELLEEYGLKGVYEANEPQVLPESVFSEHPKWRGPRVDQPNRARTPYFVPCVDRPETQELYRQAIATLLERCPAIDRFWFLTTDSGSGFCWSEALYPGANGPVACEDRSMTDRVTDFFDALEAGAVDAGAEIEYNLVEIPPQEWMEPTFEDARGMARTLSAGQAINNREGPDATPYEVDAGTTDWKGTILFPVVGIPQPVSCVESLRTAPERSSLEVVGDTIDDGDDTDAAPRLSYHVPPGCTDLYLDLYERVREDWPSDRIEAMAVLRSVAVDRVGEDHAGTLLDLWFAIDEAVTAGETIPGHPPQRIGCVHQRWLTRPFVPFPEALEDEEKAPYRPYLFQARSERQAEDLVDCQAMRPYKGWAARLLMTFVFDRVEPALERAADLSSELAEALGGERAREYEVLERRLRVSKLVARNARNAIDYQAIRDHVRDRGRRPEPNPVLGSTSSWERKFMLERARREIDTTLALIDHLEAAEADVFYAVDSLSQTDIRYLEPRAQLIEHLERKVAVMNDHWTDYRRLFTQPNP